MAAINYPTNSARERRIAEARRRSPSHPVFRGRPSGTPLASVPAPASLRLVSDDVSADLDDSESAIVATRTVPVPLRPVSGRHAGVIATTIVPEAQRLNVRPGVMWRTVIRRLSSLDWRATFMSALLVGAVLWVGFALVSMLYGRGMHAEAPSRFDAAYVVQPGDTLWSIADDLDLVGGRRDVVDVLASANGQTIVAGEELRIPAAVLPAARG